MTRIPFEWTMGPRGNPTTIKLPWLRKNNFSIQLANINKSRIDADPTSQKSEWLGWFGITPTGANTAIGSINSADIPIGS